MKAVTNQLINFHAGAPFNRKRVDFVCKVECDPVCSISWFRDGLPVEPEDERYALNASLAAEAERAFGPHRYVVQSHAGAADARANTLLHVVSTLELHAGADADLAVGRDEANYSCRASANGVGPGVESATEFRVHFPPRNVSVSQR